MKKLKITGKELRAIGYPEGPVVSLAINIAKKFFKHNTREQALKILKDVLDKPQAFLEDERLAPVALQLKPAAKTELYETSLNNQGVPFNIFGAEFIEEGAMSQMYTAAKLPVAVIGALMPDAHHGYGLPIGGVLATANEVIPYGVGVDIGCRMCLSVFNIDPKALKEKENYFAREIIENTKFGSGAQLDKAADHAVMENKAFYEHGLLRSLHTKAWKQLGTSGSGNHFVEFGEVIIEEDDEILGIPKGKYTGLLSHSGSRGLGASIAGHYTKLAMQKRRLPAEARNLAWLSLDEQEGQEYWIAMNLAGEYASACHHIIHEKIARQLGERPVKMVENHHNFAWKEKFENRDVIVHRKGATPAGKDVLGIIPGSMTANGYIVKGKGNEASVNSASHGAGRKMSRTKAMETISHSELKEALHKSGVKLLGAGLDEAPFAYKDIDAVMRAQNNLVDIVGSFKPKIVKMDGAAPGTKA